MNGDKITSVSRPEENEYIVARLDTFAGSRVNNERCGNILRQVDGLLCASKETVTTPEALLNLFAELTNNAADNVIRSNERGYEHFPPSVHIAKDGTVTVTNYGGITLALKTEDGEWLPELAFGHFRVGDNLSDDDERHTSGRNGYGSKLCNAVSTRFQVRIVSDGMLYEQTWSDSMRSCTEPKISKANLWDEVRDTYGYESEDEHPNMVQIIWSPLFDHFGLVNWPEDILGELAYVTMTIAATTGGGVHFHSPQMEFELPALSFKEFVKIHYPESKFVTLSAKFEQGDMDYAIVDTPSKHESYSTVNTAMMKLGGSHIDAIIQGNVRNLLDELNHEYTLRCQLKTIKKHLSIVAQVRVINPTFDSQHKAKLTSRLQIPLIDDLSLRMRGWHVHEVMKLKRQEVDYKIERKLNGKPNAKRLFHFDRERGVDANWAGTGKRDQTVCILTEGKTAAEFCNKLRITAQSGPNLFGYFVFTGKPRNTFQTHDGPLDDIFVDLSHFLGLQIDVDYTDPASKFRYGTIEIFADSDVDGSHITGLILGFFWKHFPSLLHAGHVRIRRSPIARAFGPNGFKQSFYSSKGLSTWWNKQESTDHLTLRYYRGLGSNNDNEVLETYKEDSVMSVSVDQNAGKSLEIVFDSNTELRKEWLRNRSKIYNASVVEQAFMRNPKMITITEFVNGLYLEYAETSLARSIMAIDGLKEAQRKAVYVLITKYAEAVRNRDVLKLHVFATDARSLTDYQRGDDSFTNTICLLARKDVPYNNLPIFEAQSQFGSRSGATDGSKMASRGLYIRPSKYVQHIFNPRDIPLLEPQMSDGVSIEPKLIYPIVPLLLPNGGRGVACGWNTYFPNHSVVCVIRELISKIEADLRGEDYRCQPIPVWFRGYNGEITPTDNGFKSSGRISRLKKDGKMLPLHLLHELPIKANAVSSVFKRLERLIEEGHLEEFDDNTQANDEPQFILHNLNPRFANVRALGIEENATSSNMNVMVPDSLVPKNFEDSGKILDYFYEWRVQIYKKRKDYECSEQTKQLPELANKIKFIKAVHSNEIILIGKTVEEIEDQIKNIGISNVNIHSTTTTSDLSKDNLANLIKLYDATNHKLEQIVSKDHRDIWKEELEALLQLLSEDPEYKDDFLR